MLDSGYRNGNETDNPWVHVDSWVPCENCSHPKIHHYAKAQEDREHCLIVMYKEKKECSCDLYVPINERERLLL